MDIERIEKLQYKKLLTISKDSEKVLEFIESEQSKNRTIYVKREQDLNCGCVFFEIGKITKYLLHKEDVYSSDVKLIPVKECKGNSKEHSTWFGALFTFYEYSTDLSILI